MSAEAMLRTERGQALAVHEHATPEHLARALGRHAVWFPAGALASGTAPPTNLGGRLTLHRHGALAGLVVDAMSPRDLPTLRGVLGLGQAFLYKAGAIDTHFVDGGLAHHLSAAGIKLFRRPGPPGGGGPLAHAPAIGCAEFLLSPPQRLRDYPAVGQDALRTEQGADGHARPRAVVLLDLVQDFEVLSPLMALAASAASPFDLRVAVTERVVKSPLWVRLLHFLEIHGIAWFTPLAPTDVANALGSAKSLLLSAAESSAAAHAFGHTVARIAPPRALRVTLQHGLECIGLRHHRAHDIDSPYGVRFASDIVLTWDHPQHLPDVHPAELHKCVPVGVVKAIAERSAGVSDQRWSAPDRQPGSGAAAAKRLLVAENLHSVRFRAPARYQRFMAFIEAARQDEGVDLMIRSHPASRTLEAQGAANRLKFLDGMLRLEDLQSFDGFVSPPSTVLLDAVMAGVPTAVWSDSANAGDRVNYAGLPVVADFSEWQALTRSSCLDTSAQMAWAVASTAALNGVPAAWCTLVHLFD